MRKRQNYTIENNITDKEIEKFTTLDIPRLNQSKKERIRTILTMRLNGETFEYIGRKFRVTRERIRQLEAKGVEIIRIEIRDY